MRSKLGLSAGYAAIAACTFACSGSTHEEATSVGGAFAAGGAQQSFGGATSATKGTSGGVGGLVSSLAATGGASSANSTATGGNASASGGNAGTGVTGGATATVKGGASAIGGSSAKGSSSVTGGTSATGGTSTKSGTSATGGSSAKGSSSVTGGTSATGGSSAKAGTSATGGSSAKGGTSATGGSPTMGGTSATGGTTATGDACAADYTWPVYSPTVAYDYMDEYGELAAPTRVSSDVSGIADRYTKDWWTFVWGSKKNSLVTAAAWVPMLERYNTDFAYITDTMRWPRDARARAGFPSAVYLYGSGLSTDTASNTDLGGWGGWASDGPIVLASYYPVYSFDPACTYNDKVSQQGAMIHEGIHSILSSMPGCKNACWFNEGGNTWLQGTMEAKRNGGTPTAMGDLSAAAAVAPFMPIECYSGWLQDGSFGGPCSNIDNRVDKKDASGNQISTWRNLLGGTQYGEAFPHAMEIILGEKSIAWVWRYASKSGRVLQDLAEVTGGIGTTQTRRLIQEYRARQAFGDFGMWKTAYKNLLNAHWNEVIQEERPGGMGVYIDVDPWNATPYVKTAASGNTLTPEERTLPGWSGANQIPLTVSSGASCVTVTFNPVGTNMSCQLVYQDTTGNVHYGTPVTSGACSIPVSNVKNNVVIAVLANTDYIYDGGIKKYGYTLEIGTGISGTADINKQWYK